MPACPSRRCAIASAFSLCRCIRMPRVLMPRDVRNASNGLDTAPAANWVNSTCSATSSCPAANTRPPPTMSEWPPRYFVVECTTTSAPSAMGCCSAGDAKVLSTTTSTPASLPSSASAATSEIFIRGFEGVSTQSTLVAPSSMAAAHRVEVAGVDGGVTDAPGAEDAADEAVRAAVHVVADHDVVAGRQHRAQQGVLGGEARREARGRGCRPRAPRAGSRARCAWGCRRASTRSRRAGRRCRPARRWR